ncbi:MAG: hypothetical protein IPI69_13240 [Bacteroidales bacterium]|nr:hypothetical protein [Bacteroidales bacterium]
MPTAVPVYDESGTTFAGSRPSAMGNSSNAVFVARANQYDKTTQMNVSGNTFVKFNILKGLSAKSLIGINQYGRNNEGF